MPSTSDLATVLESDRTDAWLQQELDHLWTTFFSDIPLANQVEISFDRAWKTRLGLIRLSESGRHTYIGINRLLSHPDVPQQVLSVTIAHELVHYSHGFGSPLPRKHRHPHHGDIVSHDLISRGLSSQLEVFKEWTNNHWYSFYYATVPQKRNGHGERSCG